MSRYIGCICCLSPLDASLLFTRACVADGVVRGRGARAPRPAERDAHRLRAAGARRRHGPPRALDPDAPRPAPRAGVRALRGTLRVAGGARRVRLARRPAAARVRRGATRRLRRPAARAAAGAAAEPRRRRRPVSVAVDRPRGRTVSISQFRKVSQLFTVFQLGWGNGQGAK